MNGENNNRFGKVAVIMGGTSSEREVSLDSGKAVFNVLKNLNVNVHKVDPKDDLVAQLYNQGFDRAFIALHGGAGEDGTIQGFLEMLKIPYTGTGVLASAINMDKIITKKILLQSGLPALPFFEVTDNQMQDEIIEKFGLPLCVKASDGGSSLGVSKVKSREEFCPAFDVAKKYSSVVLVEPWIEGREFAIPVFDGVAYPIVEIIPKDEFFTYKAKYDYNSGTEFPCPANIPLALEKEMQAIAVKAYQSTHCQGLVRVDFLVDSSSNPTIIELNTIPGLTESSLCPRSFGVKGVDIAGLVVKMLEQTF